MIEFEPVFAICFVAMLILITNVVALSAKNFFCGNFPLAISVTFASSIVSVVLILWLIEHVRFV